MTSKPGRQFSCEDSVNQQPGHPRATKTVHPRFSLSCKETARLCRGRSRLKRSNLSMKLHETEPRNARSNPCGHCLMVFLAAKSTHRSLRSLWSFQEGVDGGHIGLKGVGYRIHSGGARYGGVGLWHARLKACQSTPCLPRSRASRHGWGRCPSFWRVILAQL